MAPAPTTAITAFVLSVLGGAGVWRQASSRSGTPEEGEALRLNRLADEFIAMHSEAATVKSTTILEASSDDSNDMSMQEVFKVQYEAHRDLHDVCAPISEMPTEEVVAEVLVEASVFNGDGFALERTNASLCEVFTDIVSFAAGIAETVDVSSVSIVFFLMSVFAAGCVCHRTGCPRVQRHPPSDDSCRLANVPSNPVPVFQSLSLHVTHASMPQCEGDVDEAIPEPEADADEESQEKADMSVSESLDLKASKCEMSVHQTAVMQVASPMRRRMSS